MPDMPTGRRAKLLHIAAEIFVANEDMAPIQITVCLLGIFPEHRSFLKFRSAKGEPATLLGYGARLDSEEQAILRALGEATEPLQARGIARAVGGDETASSFRELLGPKGKLRAQGYMTHIPNEGYALTEKGRNALESLPVAS